MILDPLLDVWRYIAGLKPAFISKHPRFNFITVHYFWIIGWAIAGSILLYPAGNMAYIDALFFASGASTQSGLNTVDINKLNTYQQIVLFFIPIFCNPISINTSVVFLRLYWFEKRFQHIAKEAKSRRKSISKSRSAMRDERDHDREERGVNGRSIVVMHDTVRASGSGGVATGAELHVAETHKLDAADEKHSIPSQRTFGGLSTSSSSDNSIKRQEGAGVISPATTEPQIRFDQQVKRSDGMEDEALNLPRRWSKQDHIAFLERQRNPEDKGVLRIPGPRDQDAGMAPQSIDDDECTAHGGLGLERLHSAVDRPRGGNFQERVQDPSDGAAVYDDEDDNTEPSGHAPGRNITIAEPHRPVAEHVIEDTVAAKHTLGVLRLRIPRMLHGDTVDSRLPKSQSRSRTMSYQGIKRALTREKSEEMPYLSWEPTVGRNSAFVDLSEQQREELGGIEYRSLKSLALILVFYFWGFWFFGVICLAPWIIHNKKYGPVVDDVAVGRNWWAFFTATSAFTDMGYTLTPDSMISFQKAIWPLLSMSFLIIIGNTGFPIMLRFIIWVTTLYVPRNSGIWEELMFLLDHPRRCFTLLFPSTATWWLFWILAVLNGVDLVFFIILDLGNTVVTQLPVNIRVLDGWFQAVSTRTAGFDCVDLADLHPAIQVSYLVMMYISVLPIAISVRRTNVYEEKSLGIWSTPEEEAADESEPSYVSAHLRRQLSFDLWYIFLGLFVISIAEGSRLQNNSPEDQAFTLFAVLFEIVSAYGTVGLSLGYPTINASFSTEFGVIAKLVIIAMQIRGRHRGLPYELDRAILLPSESLQEKENNDTLATRSIRRRSSMGTINTSGGVENGRTTMTPATTIRKSRSYERGQSLLSGMLHPGPTIPNPRRFRPDISSHGRSASVVIGELNRERERETERSGERSISPFTREKRPSV